MGEILILKQFKKVEQICETITIHSLILPLNFQKMLKISG